MRIRSTIANVTLLTVFAASQLRAQKVIDLRSDLWSLGVVAFEALTGKRPFDGPSFGALAVKIATGDAPRPSESNSALPPSVDEWFAKACARDPGKRFGAARELSDARLSRAYPLVAPSLLPVPSLSRRTGDREQEASAPHDTSEHRPSLRT